jgi:nitrate/TMAO reductase-like tetraheme cytochrome c subunit
MERRRSNNIKELFRGKGKYILVGIVGIGVIIIIGGGYFFLHHGSIENPRFCALCHEVQYSFDEYKPMPATKVFSGLGIGCAECHPEPFQEYKKSKHYVGRSGFRAGCVSCHGTPHSVGEFAEYMFLTGPILLGKPGKGPGGPFFEYTSPLQDQENWKKVRAEWANRVRKWFLQTKSRTCKNCHDPELLVKFPNPQKPWAAQMMKMAFEQGKECIECHFNIVHAPVPWDPKILEEVKPQKEANKSKTEQEG